ncbi:MAG: cytochrome c oxidase, subunit [Acidobacteria bacterium]|nr:cytochrome c oxidase, subunit [Acidobacteriota bacterium]
MMVSEFPLFPEQASTVAGQVDALYLFLVVLTGSVSVLIFVLIFFLALKYRRRPDNELAQDEEPSALLEAAWIIIPFVIFMGIFVWGSWLYFRLARVPDNAIDIYATGKQWMWKFQHPTGQREINTLHVPVHRPVRITMASEDVIHSLYFPFFRVKADVLPNRYRSMWFEATKTGRFHIFCAEYCGTLHSGMIGWVEVMEPADYQRWLAGGSEGSLASQGEKLFQKYACNTCHTGDATGRGPSLQGLYGTNVMIADNTIVKADDNYIRESILDPHAKVARGFQPIMPTFQGQVNEEDLIKLLAYVKTLGPQQKPVPAVETPSSLASSAGSPLNPGAGGTTSTAPAATGTAPLPSSPPPPAPSPSTTTTSKGATP